MHALVVLHLGQALRIDCLHGILLLDDAEHAVIQVLVKVLGVGKGLRASTALARGVGSIAGELFAGAHAHRR